MNEQTPCQMLDATLRAEQYIAQQMSDVARGEFEDHFVTCADCQREVRIAIAIRAGARAVTVPERNAGPNKRGRSRLWIGVGVALAAGIGAMVIARPSSSSALALLGGVSEPPVYLGVAVRGTPGSADSIFANAMDSYAARRYTDAATGLRAALAAGQDSVPTEFFLGASLLLSHDAAGAVTALRHVIAKGDTPYRDEAQLYEAKALLRLDRGREALDVLAFHKPTDPLLASILIALGDSVTRILAR